jgi:Uma2 family endonuclease
VHTVLIPAEQRVVLDNISWSTYLAILRDAESCRGRIAYDRGVLEIMSPSKVHEHVKRLIGRMIEAFTEELNIDIESASSTTFKREDLARGFEPDECYYIAHAGVVRGKDDIDMTVDPPPDLIIEVDISRSSLNKFGIYRALGIPEVWRYDGETLHLYVLHNGTTSKYNKAPSCRSFPSTHSSLSSVNGRHLVRRSWCAGFAPGCVRPSWYKYR